MNRLLALLFTLFVASSALAAETFPAWKPAIISGGQTASQILDIGGGGTYSSALQVSGVAAIVVSYDPNRLGTGGAGVTGLYSCPDASDADAATRCTLLATYSTFTAGEVINITDSYLRTYKSTAPTGTEEAKITVRAITGSAGGGGGALDLGAGMTSGYSLLIVGDLSIANGRPYDELWAQPSMGTLQLAGYVSRSRAASGEGMANQEVEAAFALSTGSLFGAGAYFDLLSYVKKNPRDLKDVIIMVGTSDFIQNNCDHSPGAAPFDPNIQATTPCTPADTADNLAYLMGQLSALGVYSTWFMPPSWAGKFTGDYPPGAATYVSAIENTDDSLDNFCAQAGMLCKSSAALYEYACAGDASLPDPTTDTCNASNNYDLDGAGLANVLNGQYLWGEDWIQLERIVNAGQLASTYHLHPSGIGYIEFNRIMWDQINTLQPTAGFRLRPVFGVGSDNILWSDRPPIPLVSVVVGSLTATSVGIKVDRGVYVNGENGTAGNCGKQGDCKYVCWATCTDTDDTSTDPACARTANGDTVDFREVGAPNGASHYCEGANCFRGMRDMIELKNGQSGTIAGLKTGTTYDVACFAVSPTAASHPGITTITTP